MRSATLLLIVLLASSCARAATSHVPDSAAGSAPAPAAAALPAALREAARELDGIYERYRVGGLDSRRFTQTEFWAAVSPLLDASPQLGSEEIGRSVEGRPLHLVRYGSGDTAVLLWSQMHGDESTATMALADIFSFLAESPDHPVARRLAERLTIAVVPMLNPDGAERFQRRNALGIDVNRDARALATPEGRALQAMHARFEPVFGFNLHDQSVRISVGDEDRTAAISLLAPPHDEARSDNEVRVRAKRLAAAIRHAVDAFVGGHVARYDDTFNPRAFGDLMQSWGTSTVLVESGGWSNDPEKQFLRRVHFSALLAALDAIATGAYAHAALADYEDLPENGAQVNDLLLRGGSVVVPGLAPYTADIAINFGDALARENGRIADIGDLADYRARDTLDVRGLFLHPEPPADAADDVPLAVGRAATFTIRRGADPASEPVWSVRDGVVRRAEDD